MQNPTLQFTDLKPSEIVMLSWREDIVIPADAILYGPFYFEVA